MKTTILSMLAIALLMGTASAAMTCDIPGSACTETDWGAPNCAGNYGGFDGVGCENVAMVVAPGNCDGSDMAASVSSDTHTIELVVTSNYETWSYCDGYGHLAVNWISMDADSIQVRALDGMDDDSFDVYLDDEFVCSVDIEGGVEEWKTFECDLTEGPIPAPEFASLLIPALLVVAVPGFAYIVRKRK